MKEEHTKLDLIYSFAFCSNISCSKRSAARRHAYVGIPTPKHIKTTDYRHQ
jgi:hypothetical protein